MGKIMKIHDGMTLEEFRKENPNNEWFSKEGDVLLKHFPSQFKVCLDLHGSLVQPIATKCWFQLMGENGALFFKEISSELIYSRI